MSIQPRKQRKAWSLTPMHLRRKRIASHLSEELLLRYNVRRTPVISGDEVEILRGDHRGKKGKVVRVDTRDRIVVVEGITHKKADGTDIAMPLDASNLLITRLNLEDKRRRAKLGAKEGKAPEEAKAAPTSDKPAVKVPKKAKAKAPAEAESKEEAAEKAEPAASKDAASEKAEPAASKDAESEKAEPEVKS